VALTTSKCTQLCLHLQLRNITASENSRMKLFYKMRNGITKGKPAMYARRWARFF